MHTDDHSPSPVEAAAVQWLARRDRGLSASEQDAYLQWLQEAPAHGAEIARLERAWTRLDTLRHWHPAHSSRPNPDLLAPRRRQRHRWIWPSALAAAAAIAFAAVSWWRPAPDASTGRSAVIQPNTERVSLDDGSFVELNTGARIEVEFTAATRGVRLLNGEAHFVVAKDSARPFVVTAKTFSVRAVGTAFAVRLQDEEMSVLVTEGKVQLDESSREGNHSPTTRKLSGLVAGQEAIVRMRPGDEPRLEIRDVTPAQIEHALAWQSMHLEFIAMPLRDVVEEFNRYNSRKLVIEDQLTGDIVVGGSFRADNVEPFVRLLDLGFGVSAYPRGDDIILRRRR